MLNQKQRSVSEWLVVRAQQGERSAFEALIKLWHQRFYVYAMKRTRDREAAQDITQETLVSIGLIIITVILLAGSMNLTEIVDAQDGGLFTWHLLTLEHWIVLPVMVVAFVMFFVSALAETNRPPFDLPEAESELVAGHMVEYSSTLFLLFFLGEFVAIQLMCALVTILFLGGWLPPFDVWFLNWVPGIFWFLLKMLLVFFAMAMVRTVVPRYRYDQLMRLGWKVFLPLSLGWVVIVAFLAKFELFGGAYARWMIGG